MGDYLSDDVLEILAALDIAAEELEYHNSISGEWTPLEPGDRVVLLSPDGELSGTVLIAWRPHLLHLAPPLKVRLDRFPFRHIELHRSLFRSFTVLDHLSEA
ncbi:MAG: hypothetical protein AB7L09_00440 [Nitrospira sp.]